LSNEKNLELLLRCFVGWQDDHPSIHLAVVGDGPRRESLKKRFVHPSITFTSWKKGQELAALFASADFLALPSTTETLSLVALEAMASGLPVLAMSAGGVKNVVEHWRTGLLANSEDEFNVFFRRMIKDAALRSQFGLNGRRYAEGKTWTRAFENLEHSYKQLLAEKQEDARRDLQSSIVFP
jgi:glycosyltransferase involved in cell wall biosynthesis